MNWTWSVIEKKKDGFNIFGLRIWKVGDGKDSGWNIGTGRPGVHVVQFAFENSIINSSGDFILEEMKYTSSILEEVSFILKYKSFYTLKFYTYL